MEVPKQTATNPPIPTICRCTNERLFWRKFEGDQGAYDQLERKASWHVFGVIAGASIDLEALAARHAQAVLHGILAKPLDPDHRNRKMT